MGIKFECPKCGNHLSAGDDYAGKEGKCKCGAAVIVPGDADRLRFRCGKCGKGISVRKAHAGKQGRCPTCKNVLTVPVLGMLLDPSGQRAVAAAAAPRPKAASPAGVISFACPMCSGNVLTRENSAGNIMECPACGCFVEVPGQPEPHSAGGIATDWQAEGAAVEPAGQPVVSTGKTVCPSCQKKLVDDAPVCTHCFAVRGFWVVLFYIMFDVIAVSLMVTSGTAHWAHIGGLVWGFAIAFALLAGRLAYSRSDMLSLILGRYAWRIIGTPASRMK